MRWFPIALLVGAPGCIDRTARDGGDTSTTIGEIGSTTGGSSTGLPEPIECPVFEADGDIADPNATPEDARCSGYADAASCEAATCTAVWGRQVKGCSADGEPTCEAPAELIGCGSFALCKIGTSYFCRGDDPSDVYVSDRGCIPHGFASCDAPTLPPTESPPPTCGY